MIIGKASIEQALNVRIIRNTELETAQRIWQSMLDGRASWNNDANPSLHLASSICREISNNTTFELEAELTGNETLAEQFAAAIEQMPEIVSLLSGLGSLVLKPFVRVDKIMVTIATPDRFFPLKYNEIGDLTSVAFADSMNTAEDYYTLLELHTWDEPASGYSIEYKAFHSRQPNDIGKQVPVVSVPAWAHLEDINWQNITQPLFVEISMPDKQAIFSKAVELIRLADEQYGRAVWEYEGGELAVHASIDLFKPGGTKKGDQAKVPALPKGKERQYRVIEVPVEQFVMDTYSPDLRDTSLFNGLNEFCRKVEFACSLAYGIISDVNNQDKTATEIRAGKQRLLVTIRTIQKIVEEAYTHIAESMNTLGQLYSLFPATTYDIAFVWGDSVLEDPQEEYARRLQLVGAGIISPAEFRAFYFGESLEEAAKMIPAQQTQSIE